VTRILYVYGRRASFIELDRSLLAERWSIEDWYQPGRYKSLRALVRSLRRSAVVVGWWAHWHTFWPVTLAWVWRKPAVLIIGGFDVANMPEIEYGHQRGGVRKWLSGWVIHRASTLVTNSEYSVGEIERNLGLPASRVRLVHHGVPDRFEGLAERPREGVVLSVGHVDRVNLERKGHRPFVQAARQLPEVSFVLAGPWDDDAAEALRAEAPPNVTLTGRLEQDALDAWFGRASVYVQPSQHEGFGISVAEAMLAGCVPVVSRAGALPEVVGDAGVVLESREPEAIAAGVREALAMGPEAGRRARERVLTHFPVEGRRRGLWAAVEAALEHGRRRLPAASV
jgi:glycosyltransferase involved in cell wall biosynthesis